MERTVALRHAVLAEMAGTFLLAFFGTGAVHVAVLYGGLSGLLQVALIWGCAVALAILAAAGISGAHFNPAVTLALAVFRGFPPGRIAPYVLAQIAGAFLAGAVLYALFSPQIEVFERAHGLVRGTAGSELSAMLYGEYFPNPAMTGTTPAHFALVPEWRAMLAEGLGTALLVGFIFALTDPRNAARPQGAGTALGIGLAVTIVICIVAPLTQAGLNPARDFGPRLFAWLAGWGEVAIPGPRGGFFTVYILSPLLGGLAGGGAYMLLLAPGQAGKSESA